MTRTQHSHTNRRSLRGVGSTLAGLGAILLAVQPSSAKAEMPPGKLVMLDISPVSAATSLQEGDNTHLRFEELMEAGVNGLHFRAWTAKGDGYPSKEEWVKEAHEWGFWVAGGTSMDQNNSLADSMSHAKTLAEMGVDFIQLDEPMHKPGFDGNAYAQIQGAAHAVDPSIPVVVSDVFYNDEVAQLPNVQGLIQEVYFDGWLGNIDLAENYKANYPNQDVLMWVWLPQRPFVPDDCGVLPDEKFDNWFTQSFDRIDKTLLFIFYSRDAMGDDCSYAANWQSRAATIANKTEGYRAPLPVWGEFSATAPPGGHPDGHVQVRSDVGLNPETAKVEYSPDFGASWMPWDNVEWTGTLGTTEWIDITFNDLPIEMPGDNILVRFKVTDTYEGTYYRGPRTARKTFTLNTVMEVPEEGTGTDTDSSGTTGDDSTDGTDSAGTTDGTDSAGTTGNSSNGTTSAGSGAETTAADSSSQDSNTSGGGDMPDDSGCGCTAGDSPSGGLLALGVFFFAFRRKSR